MDLYDAASTTVVSRAEINSALAPFASSTTSCGATSTARTLSTSLLTGSMTVTCPVAPAADAAAGGAGTAFTTGALIDATTIFPLVGSTWRLVGVPVTTRVDVASIAWPDRSTAVS